MSWLYEQFPALDRVFQAVAKIVDVVAPIAIAIPGPWTIPAMAYTAITTVSQGGGLGDVVKNIGTPYLLGAAGGAVAGSVGAVAAEAGLGATAASAVGGAAAGASTALISGGDPLTGALTGGVGGAAGDIFNSGGDHGIFKDTTADFTPTTNYGSGADYSLGGGSSVGLTAPVSSTGYDLTSASTGLGLRNPSSVSLYGMNGGQGLTANTSQGRVGAVGLTPTGASPVLGNPNSFINNPNTLGRPIVGTDPAYAEAASRQKLLEAALKAGVSVGAMGMMGGDQGSSNTYTPYRPANTMPVYNQEYFQAVQDNYNKFMPDLPKDVITPLQGIYQNPYIPNGQPTNQGLFRGTK